MKSYEKEFMQHFREIIISARYPRDREGCIIISEAEDFLAKFLKKELDLFNHFQIEDIIEKSIAVSADMNTLIYLLHDQIRLTTLLDVITSKLMTEYEIDTIALRQESPSQGELDFLTRRD